MIGELHIAGFQEIVMAWEGVEVLMKTALHSAMINFGCISSSFQGLKYVWLCCMAKLKEKLKK